MTSSADTIRRLAEMSDVAKFECIAAAVLRAAKPAIYESIAHPGVQPGGKTRKAPFDNIGLVNLSDGNCRLVCAAHTTEQKDLEGKWIHDPAKVKTRKPGGKPTKPAGDLIKGIAEIEKLREKNPGLAVTLALTTNIEPSLKLLVIAREMAVAANIELDIWSVSRIAHFLDTDSTGQMIRQSYLGTPIQLLSRDLLLKIGKQSIQSHCLNNTFQESIYRDDFRLGCHDALVVGESGMGKTTACVAALLEYIDSGIPAIVIKTEYISTAPTIEVALESELKRQFPALQPGAGEKAIALCTTDAPLLILFEDINRSTSPELLLNKIISWSCSKQPGNSSGRCWRAICPIWPRYLNVIENQKLRLAEMTILRVDKYSPAQAVQAVVKRAQTLSIAVDEGRAAVIASNLGRDPLLIGLHKPDSNELARDVIWSYIDERIGIVANEHNCAKSEVYEAIHHLLRKGLQHRRLTPNWSEVRSWIEDKSLITLLRDLIYEGSVIRFSQADTEEAIEFRHDRVMYSLLSDSLTGVMNSSVRPEYVTDPFFAEVVALAAIRVSLPREDLLCLMESSPTVGAYALKICSEQQNDYLDTAAKALTAWLNNKKITATTMASRRYAIALILAETTSVHIAKLVHLFPQEDRSYWEPLLAAQFRNGNLHAGLELLSRYRLGVTVAGKQALLSLVKHMYGEALVTAVGTELSRTDLTPPFRHRIRIGALRLAGYIGSNALAQSIQLCWKQDSSTERDLCSYLFAAARCCGNEVEATLGPVCDAWENLPDEPDSSMGQPIERLAATSVAWEFRNYIPQDAIRYLVERANASKRLNWPITYCLRAVDHPVAVEHIVRFAAMSNPISAYNLMSGWRRNPTSRGMDRQMSPESRSHLLRIALDKAELEVVRKKAFSLWEETCTAGDISTLHQISDDDPLFEYALWARAQRGDYSIIPHVLLKIPEKPEHWLRIGSYVWSDAMTESLDFVMGVLADEEGKGYSNLEYAVADALMEVDPMRRISMLQGRWEKLKTRPLMVQTVLLTTESNAITLARKAFEHSQNPCELLQPFAIDTLYNTSGKRQLSTLNQLNNLRPYLSFLSEEDLLLIWDICTNNGWLDFQRRYLEPRICQISKHRPRLSADPIDITTLEKALNPAPGEHVNLFRWLERTYRGSVTRDKAFAALLQWLTINNQDKALYICAEIVSNECTRSEFVLFEKITLERENSSDLIESVRFNVFKRTLV